MPSQVETSLNNLNEAPILDGLLLRAAEFTHYYIWLDNLFLDKIYTPLIYICSNNSSIFCTLLFLLILWSQFEVFIHETSCHWRELLLFHFSSYSYKRHCGFHANRLTNYNVQNLVRKIFRKNPEMNRKKLTFHWPFSQRAQDRWIACGGIYGAFRIESNAFHLPGRVWKESWNLGTFWKLQLQPPTSPSASFLCGKKTFQSRIK